MAKYFNFFPKTTYYKGKDSTSVDILTNITARYNFNDGLKQNAATYYKYKIKKEKHLDYFHIEILVLMVY